ncbi:coiled-coil domain-containing protein [Acrasis kona]|uniref:Coiled-coil domain-containing protein n=1 Tax=Acrasis kona TaxID=1008807 RepID=A0AAW2YX22_9EUKA
MDAFDEEHIDYAHLPDFLLNDKNKELQRKIKESERRVSDNQSKVDVQNERNKNLINHLKSLKVEHETTKSLLESKHKEIETENHLKMVAEREVGRLKSEVLKFEKEHNDIQDKVDGVQNEIFRANEKMDQFKNQMLFNQEELEQWSLARKQKEDDQLALEKYRRQDETKIKELSLKIEKLSREVEDRKSMLEREITDTQASQIELAKTAEDFKALHKERQHLIEQWQDALKNMNKRDQLIMAAGEKFAQGKVVIREKQEILYQESQHLNIHIQNNRELDQKILKVARTVEKSRSELEGRRGHLTDLNDQLEVIKNTLAKASTDLNNKRTEIKIVQQSLEAKMKKLAYMQANKSSTEENLSNKKAILNDLEAQTDYVDKMLLGAETEFKSHQARLKELKEEFYKESQDLFKLINTKANHVAEISGTNAQNKNMAAKIQQKDNEVFKQQELLYNIEFKSQQMERKVNRAQGQRTEEEKEVLNQRIKDLNVELEVYQQQYTMLNVEWNKVQAEVRTMQKQVEVKQKDKDRLEDKVQELDLQNETHEVEYKEMMKQKENNMVNHDVQKLQVKRLRDLLRSRADEVSGLENRKNQLEITYKEKELQVNAHKELLRLEMKNAEDERRQLSLELSERKVQVDKLKNKFAIHLQRLKPDEGEETISQSQFLLRAIHEREELQRKGDMLDESIQQLEKEEKAIDLTLAQFHHRNHMHMSTFKHADKDDADLKLKYELEQKVKDLDTILSRRVQEKRNYEASLQAKKEELAEIIEQKRDIEARRQALMEAKNQLLKEIDRLKQSVSTSYSLMKNGEKEARRKVFDGKEVKMKDIEYLENSLKLSNGLKLLVTLSQNDNHLRSTMERVFGELRIELPIESVTPSTPSKTSSSLPNSRLGSRPSSQVRKTMLSSRGSVRSSTSSTRSSVSSVMSSRSVELRL